MCLHLSPSLHCCAPPLLHQTTAGDEVRHQDYQVTGHSQQTISQGHEEDRGRAEEESVRPRLHRVGHWTEADREGADVQFEGVSHTSRVDPAVVPHDDFIVWDWLQAHVQILWSSIGIPSRYRS